MCGVVVQGSQRCESLIPVTNRSSKPAGRVCTLKSNIKAAASRLVSQNKTTAPDEHRGTEDASVEVKATTVNATALISLLGAVRTAGVKSRRAERMVGPGVVPNRARTILRYGDLIDLTPGAINDYHVIRCSAYDPDLTGVGEQPLGFDQWMSFYTNFIVLRARLVGRYAPVTSSSCSMHLAQYLTRGTTPPLTVGATISEPYCKVGLYAPGAPSVVLDSGWHSMASFFGMSESEYRAVEDFWGTASADPSVPARFVIYQSSLDGSTNCNCDGSLLLELDVEFFNRVQLNQS